MKDSRIRSVTKALTWRFIATTTTMSLVYIATGNLELAAHVGAADVIIKLFFYYVHERAWGRIRWQRAVRQA